MKIIKCGQIWINIGTDKRVKILSAKKERISYVNEDTGKIGECSLRSFINRYMPSRLNIWNNN